MPFGVAWLSPAPVEAQGEVDLTWSAPADCPQREAVRQRLRSLADPALRDAGQIRADGRIVRVDGRYRLTISVRDEGEIRERTIEAESCVDLAGAAVVALGLLVRKAPETPPGAPGTEATTGGTETKNSGSDVGKSTSPSDKNSATEAKPEVAAPAAKAAAAKTPSDTKKEPEKEPEGDDEPEGASETDVPSPFEDVSRPSGGIEPILRAPLVAWDFVRLPEPSFSVGGGLGVRYGGWRFVASGRIVFDQTWLMPGSSEVGAEVGRVLIDLSVCRGFRTGRLELAPCLTVGLDRVSARGTGAGVSPRSQHALSAVFGAAAATHLYVFDSMAIFVFAGAGIETSRPYLVVEGLGRVGQLRPALVSIGLGPEWIF